MNLKKISIYLLMVSIANSSTFDDIKKQTLNNNQSLKIFKNDIKISQQNELLSTKWKNIVLGFGANGLLINDIGNRDAEKLQTQFITLSQSIPLGNKLEIKKTLNVSEKTIIKYILEDKKSKYNSLILSYLNQYTILKHKVYVLNVLRKNTKKIISFQKDKFRLKQMGQISIINNQNNLLQIEFKIKNLESKQEIMKINLENISYVAQSKIKHTLQPMVIPSINNKELLSNNNMYIALMNKIKKNKQNISLQKSLKTNDLKINLGYYQRNKFDDFLAFSVSYPLSIYGSENIKVEEAKIKKIKSEIFLKEFENEFNIKIKTLLTNMKIAKYNYDLIVFDMIQNNILIDKLLKSQSVQSGVNSIAQLKNKNNILNKKIQAIDEKMKFYKASASLEYYKGKTL